MNSTTFTVDQKLWNSWDNDQRELFNKIYNTEREKRNELLDKLNPECRDTVANHYDNIIGNVITSVIQHQQNLQFV